MASETTDALAQIVERGVADALYVSPDCPTPKPGETYRDAAERVARDAADYVAASPGLAAYVRAKQKEALREYADAADAMHPPEALCSWRDVALDVHDWADLDLIEGAES